MPVSVSPGQMQFTRMFCGPWSTAIAFVSSTTAPFDAQYTAAFAPPVSPHPEAVLMIEPPPAFCMCGITSRDSKKIDFTLTVITRSQSSSLRSRTVARRMMPALLNRMSILPNSRSVRSTTRRQSPARVISADSKHPRPPAFSISVAASCPVFAFTSAITISAPSLANNNAVARPIPEAPPVMIATLLASCISAAGKPSHSFSAVTGVHVPGYVGGVVRCEKREQRRNLLRLGVAAERNFLVHLFAHLVGVLGALHGCQDVTGRDRAHADFGSEFERHRFRQFDHAGFGRVVVCVVGIAHHAVGRRCLQNYAATALHHVPGGRLRYVEDAGEVHGDHFVPLFWGNVEKVVTNADAGVVDENVDPAHNASGFREGCLHLLEVRHISRNRGRQAGEFVLDILASLVVAVEHAHYRALLEKAGRRRGADAAGATGDQDSFRFQAAHAFLQRRKSGRSGYLSARNRAILIERSTRWPQRLKALSSCETVAWLNRLRKNSADESQFRRDRVGGELLQSKHARKRRAAGSGLQLCECGTANRSRSSAAADSSDDGWSAKGTVAGVRPVVCERRSAVDCAREAIAGAAVAGVVLAAERAAADGGDELQPAVSLVRGAGDGRRGVGCDGVHQESGAAAGGSDLAEVFAGGGEAGTVGRFAE